MSIIVVQRWYCSLKSHRHTAFWFHRHLCSPPYSLTVSPTEFAHEIVLLAEASTRLCVDLPLDDLANVSRLNFTVVDRDLNVRRFLGGFRWSLVR
jgi:hypothetical protein